MTKERRGTGYAGEREHDDAAPVVAPGKVTLAEQLGKPNPIVSLVPGRTTHSDRLPVQRKAGAGKPKRPDAIARRGVAGTGSQLPHLDQIQAAFGRHDVSQVRAHTGSEAEGASRELGARAYATGNDVAFAGSPDLHTAAHEAAHVVQQRGGVQLKGGIDGGASDPYEQHADAVADAVVAGRSAEPLLDQFAHAGADASSTPDVQRKGEPEADVDALTYRSTFAQEIGDGIIEYFSKYDVPSGSRFLTFLGPLKSGPSIVAVTGTALNAKLDEWLTKDKVHAAINRARPKGVVNVTDGDKTWVEDKINDGPARWFPDVATELAAALHALLRTSLDRVVPRYLSAAVATGIAEEEKLQACPPEVTPPKRSDVIASAPIDLVVIDALIAHAKFDYAGYRQTYPTEKGKLGVLRPVTLTLEAPQDGLFYARVSAPADASPEEVANTLFGESTKTGELKIVAPPLFGFTDGSKLKPEYGSKLTAMGIDLNVQVYDWVAAAAKGPMAEEIAKNQGKQQATSLSSKAMILGALDESIAIIPTIEESGVKFGMGKNPIVSSVAPLKKELADRRATLSNATEQDALAWAGQVEGQQKILSQVSFSFARHASRLADLTKMITDANVKLGGFNLPDHVREAMLVVAMRYADVALLSKLPETAKIKLAEVEDEAGVLPITFLEGTLATIQRSLDDARNAKHSKTEHASYDVGGMSKREQELKQRLAALRIQVKTDPEGATKELGEISKLVHELQIETELVANMDHIDAAWQALEDGISFWWTGLYTQYQAGKLKDRGDELHKKWKKIFNDWKSGDAAKQEQAKKDLEALRADPGLATWLGEVKDVLEDARIQRLIGMFVALIAITVVTAGIGDLVAAGAAGWGLSAGGTAVLVGGVEAATFTLLNQIFLDSDHSFGHIVYEFGANWAMFGVMRRFQMFAEVAQLSKAKAIGGSVLIMAASTYAKADLDIYLKEGRHLNEQEVKHIALQGMAMAIAMHAIAPATKSMFAELEGSAYVFGTRLRANNKTQRVLTEGFEALKQTKDFNKARDLVTAEKKWLEERVKILDEVAEQAKKEADSPTKPKDGGIAAKIKMDAKDLAALRSDLQAKLAEVSNAQMPLLNLEPKGHGLFTCPRENIHEVVKNLGEVVKTERHPETTVLTYEVRLSDGSTIKVMEKIDAVADWVAALRGRLGEKGQLALQKALETKTAKQLMDEFHGDLDAVANHLAPGEKPQSLPDTIDMFGVGNVPKDPNAKWAFKDKPENWSADRQALHDKLIEKAKLDAQKFADAMQGGEPTLFAMRGNTAAGKTRAVSGSVPQLAGPMAATKNAPYRAVNPDAFKPDLMAATPGGATSSQVHAESSMLATRLEGELMGLKTSDGKELGSVLVDKRLANLSDVQHYAKLAKDSGRKFVLYDVDAPLEVSLAGVLERQPGGSDPLPGFEVVAKGFEAVRGNRRGVIDAFTKDASFGEYTLYGTKANGDRVPVADVKNGALTIHDPVMFADVVAGPGEIANVLATKRISEEGITELTAGLDASRARMVGNLLRRYIGWTWKSALDAHSAEMPALQPKATGP
jgi:hypothetical protein